VRERISDGRHITITVSRVGPRVIQRIRDAGEQLELWLVCVGGRDRTRRAGETSDAGEVSKRVVTVRGVPA